MDYKSLTIDSIQSGLRAKTFSATELAKQALADAERENASINAILSFCPERALAAAAQVDAKLAAGEDPGPLAGVPVAVKDVILAKGVRNTCGSKILEEFVAPYTATAVARMEAAGAVTIGKANCDEFAMGSSNENSAFGPVKNPAAPDRVPGGSSGGSAAAVAAGMSPVSLGSDTGGSIRQPAAFCGVVGVLPTYGRVSRYGLSAFASSLDRIGPFSKTVKDSALLLAAISGKDPHDATSAPAPVPNYAAALDGNVKGLKIGVPKEYFAAGLDPQIGDRIEAGIAQLEKLGCERVDISLPHTEYAVATYYLICTAEASANLARYDGVRYTRRSAESGSLGEMYRNSRHEGFGKEVTRRIILGTYVLSAGYYDAYYRKAQKVRRLITNDFQQAFQQVDAIVTPVTPAPPFKIGEKTADPLSMYLSDIYTITASLAGLCGLSAPCGKTAAEGLPVGMQILGNHFQEERILKLADAFERAGGFEG
ncbi:MAG: Asp-tRNA(Asn)/Glu-tRNA(Gln) amidotransferase subunit GatA [Acidobacteria bacterium]|nr:Asp-tRNA(Asn)/Glu-tRNA(Gln) amidotransferase subunit GatA [Acidobacteriota bacterium]